MLGKQQEKSNFILFFGRHHSLVYLSMCNKEDFIHRNKPIFHHKTPEKIFSKSFLLHENCRVMYNTLESREIHMFLFTASDKLMHKCSFLPTLSEAQRRICVY